MNLRRNPGQRQLWVGGNDRSEYGSWIAGFCISSRVMIRVRVRVKVRVRVGVGVRVRVRVRVRVKVKVRVRVRLGLGLDCRLSYFQ